MSQVVVERQIDLEAERGALWCAVADTERLNRAVGLGRLELEPLSDASAARFVVRTVSAGLSLEYEERSFEWSENEHFSVQRIHRSGLVRPMDAAFRLDPRPGGGTRLTMRIAIKPRYALLAPLVRLQLTRMSDRIEAEFRAVDRDLQTGKPVCFRSDTTKTDRTRLERAKNALLESVCKAHPARVRW